MYRIEMKKKCKVQYITNVKPINDNYVQKRNIFIEILNDYFLSSSLHGIGYLGAKDKNFFEKIWWAVMFILSVTTCSFLISKTWIKWKDNPVILSFEKEQIPIWDIPFPAITICPMNKVLQSHYNYTEMFRNRENLTDEDYKIFWDLALVCNPDLYIGKKAVCSINVTDKSALTMIHEYAPSIAITLNDIKWQNKLIDISNFAEQITEEGICFTFNSFNQEDMYTDELDHEINYIRFNLRNEGWTMEDGYPPNVKMNTHPKRSVKDGQDYGLSFQLTAWLVDTDYVCNIPTSGFKIILHNPIENPKASQQYFLVPLDKLTTIIVRPEIVSTSKSLKDLPPHTRKCYFADEKYLRFYKVYTQNNCRVECTANITRQFCGCVPFYMPKDNNTSICGYGSNDCIKKVANTILKVEVMKNFSEILREERKIIKKTYKIFSQCDCMPACTNIQYSAETSQTEYHLMKAEYAAGQRTSENYKIATDFGVTRTVVNIFYKESQFFALHRSELYGQTDFLANCGGLLGLFMGFSLLSFMEIIYFLTIRLWFKYRSRSKIHLNN